LQPYGWFRVEAIVVAANAAPEYVPEMGRVPRGSNSTTLPAPKPLEKASLLSPYAAILLLQKGFSRTLKNAKLSAILSVQPRSETLEKASPVLPYEVFCQNSRKTPHYPA
jgi:hypothetical protein